MQGSSVGPETGALPPPPADPSGPLVLPGLPVSLSTHAMSRRQPLPPPGDVIPERFSNYCQIIHFTFITFINVLCIDMSRSAILFASFMSSGNKEF